jgi:hypothetical protein
LAERNWETVKYSLTEAQIQAQVEAQVQAQVEAQAIKAQVQAQLLAIKAQVQAQVLATKVEYWIVTERVTKTVQHVIVNEAAYQVLYSGE